MENYVTKVLKTAQEIVSTGKALDDDLIATLLLRGLTPKYKTMSLAIQNSGVYLITDYIKMKLLQEGYKPNPKTSYSPENVLGPTTNVERPISLLPILSKVYEKRLLSRLLPIIENRRLIPDHQFGFRQ
jgi:hypothetical protein